MLPASPLPAPMDRDEPGRLVYFVARVVSLVDDLPFIPLKPYQHRWLQLGWRGGVLTVLAVIAFWPSFGGWLWQDERLLANDLVLRNAYGLGAIWRHALGAELSPMARSLAWVEFHLPGNKATTFRVVSLLLHVWTCLFGWFVLRRLAVPAAWLIAALWAVHPSALPTVAWPSRQGDLLAAAASATAVWAYLAARRIRPYVNERIWTDPAYHEDEDHTPVWPWVVVALATGVALPCASAVPAFAVLGVAAIEWVRGGLRRIRGLVFAGVLAFTLVARCLLPHGPAPAEGVEGAAAARFAEAIAAAPWAAVHALVPLDFPIAYDRWQWEGGAWTAVLAAATALLLVVPWLFRRTALPALAVAAAFAVAHGLTVPHRSPAIAAADLLPYVGGVAGVAIVVMLLARLLQSETLRPFERAVRWGGGIVVLLAAGTLTISRGPDFADAEHLWQHAVALNPDSAVAHEELATRFVEQDFLDEAGTQLDRVADRQRGYRWFVARGRVFDAQKRYGEAVGCYETAHSKRPDDISTTTILAESYANTGRADAAAALYDDLLRRVTTDANLYTNAGLAKMRLRHMHDAVDDYRTALKLDPNHIAAHVNLANALFELQQYREAAEHLQKVVALDPRNYVAFMNAGVMLASLGDPAKAEQMFRAAVHLNPQSADAYRKLSGALAAQKKDAEAAWCDNQANRIGDGSHGPMR